MRNDPGYTPNIQHLVFPKCKDTQSKGTSQSSQFKNKSSGVASTTTRRLNEVLFNL